MSIQTKLGIGILLAIAIPSQARSQATPVPVRVGHFANMTHAQALVGRANGWFEKAMGPQVRVEWKTFNAGPSAIEALYAGALDLVYVGPNPTISGYVRSQGEALRVIAGATSGGAALVVRSDSGINRPEDFHHKRVASPQLANTQDVALRAWLLGNGMRPTDKGGDVQVLPIENADQMTLFLKKEIDAAWCPEPWASRLIQEAGGRLFLDERELWPNGRFVAAHLIVRTQFLREHPDLVKQWVRAHVQLTDWINHNLPEAKRILNAEIGRETGKQLPEQVFEQAFARTEITYDPVRSSLLTSARRAFDAGFLGRNMPDLSGLYDLSILNAVLLEEGRSPIQ
jgi:NitT/TauT family transport system substrate-binding protein